MAIAPRHGLSRIFSEALCGPRSFVARTSWSVDATLSNRFRAATLCKVTSAFETHKPPHRPAAALLLASCIAAAIAIWSSAHLACISRDGTHYIEFAKQLAEDPAFYIRAQRSQP